MELMHQELKHISVRLSYISETLMKSEEIKFQIYWEPLHWLKYITTSALNSSFFLMVDWSGTYEGSLRLKSLQLYKVFTSVLASV